MDEKEINEWKEKIDNMTQEDRARLHRFASIGHPVFDVTLPLNECFKNRFGGFTPELSKKIGWL